MERVDQRKVRAITEQTTRNALNEQQLNEAGFIKGLGTVGKALWNGGKNFFRGAGPGLGGRMGRSLGFGAKNAMKDYNRSLVNLGRYEKGAIAASDRAGQFGVLSKINPGVKPWANKAYQQADKWNAALNNARLQTDINGQFAMQLAKNSARAKGLGLGLLGGGLLGAGLAGGSSSSSSPAYSDPQMSSTPMVDPMFQSNPYAGYYSGAYSDPYAAYYSGAYSDPYAAYSNPYGGGGSSSNNMDLATMMAIMNQGGDSSTLPMMMAMNGGNIDDQTLQMMMMMNQGGGNDIWGLGGYHA